MMSTYISGRNKSQKLVRREDDCRLLTAVPLKMYSKFGQPQWTLVSQILKNGQWPTVTSTGYYNV